MYEIFVVVITAKDHKIEFDHLLSQRVKIRRVLLAVSHPLVLIPWRYALALMCCGIQRIFDPIGFYIQIVISFLHETVPACTSELLA